jgi:hypothetical protein
MAVIVVTLGWLGPQPVILTGGAYAQQSTSAGMAVVKRYEIFEETFAIPSGRYGNPWEDVNLTMIVTPPSGKPVRVGGFYYAPDTWKVRLAPWFLGRWSWRAIANDRSGKVFERLGAFQVVPSGNHGFVRRDPANPFRLIFDDGTLYPAIGIGDCIDAGDHAGGPPSGWGLDGGFRAPGDHKGRTVDIDTYLSAYATAGFNLFRWSVDNCSFQLWEKISTDGNRYLEREGQWGDGLVQKLRQYGFRVYMGFFGGEPFFAREASNTAAMDAVKRYVKYITDRYGAYVDVWELMNETTAEDAWYTIVAGTLRGIDPYHHLISTSSERPRDPAIDITSPHWYETEREFDSDEVTMNHINPWKEHRKPIIFGEQGNNGHNWDPRSGLRMRLRSWSAFFNEGILVFWNTSGFKDNNVNLYIGPEERGYVRALQAFVQGFPPDIGPARLRVSEPARVRGYGLQSRTLFAAYLHNFSDHERPMVGLSITIDSPVTGRAIWYNPTTGAVVATTSVSLGTRALTVPPFVVDIALKIQPVAATSTR